MTNDTNTLNGSLKELGETMAANLTAQGVSSTWDEGLMTLASKILDIGPSPTVDSLTLAKTAGKQILSYADSGATPETEYCTVTATALDSNNQGVRGQSVVFKVGTTTVATETTDSNGEASYTYVSAGSGDVVLSAECSSLQETYSIRDAKFYDASSSSNVNKYSKTGNGTISYDSTNQCYLLNNGSTNWKWTSFIMSNVDFSNTVTVKAKIRLLTNYNCQVSLGLYGSKGLVGNSILASNVSFYAVQIGEQELQSDVTSKGQETLTSSDIQANKWYDVEITYSSGSTTFKLYDGSTLVKSVTGSSSVLTSDSNKLMFNIGMYGNSQANIKDITIL